MIKKAHYIDENSLLVKKLYEVYLKHTGDIDNPVRVTSARDYAAEMENSVVFGGEFPNGPQVILTWLRNMEVRTSFY